MKRRLAVLVLVVLLVGCICPASPQPTVDEMAWLSGYGNRKTIATVLDDTLVENYPLPVRVIKGSPTAVNQSLHFDSSNSEYGETFLPQFPAGKQDASIECWMKFATTGFTDDGLWREFVSIYDGAGKKVCLYIIRTAGSYYLRGQFYVGAPAAYFIESGAVSAGTWYHCAVTYDADGDDGEGHGRMVFYVDGAEQTKNGDEFYDIGADPDYAHPMKLRLARDDGGTRYLECYLQEIRISDSFRSSTEVEASYNGGSGVRLEPDDNTVALYHSDNGCWESYEICSDAGVFYGTTLNLEQLKSDHATLADKLICYYYKGDAHMGDYNATNIAYKTSTAGKTWGAETAIYTSDATHCLLLGGAYKTPGGNFAMFAEQTESTWETKPTQLLCAYSDTATEEGTTWPGAMTELLPAGWTEDLLGTSRFSAYHEEDVGRITVISSKITVVDADRDELIYVAYDFGGPAANRLVWDFELYVNSGHGGGSAGGLGGTTQARTSQDNWADDDFLAFTSIRAVDTNTFRIAMQRFGSDTTWSVDDGTFSCDTLYYCRVYRAKGSATITFQVYSDAARTVLVGSVNRTDFSTSAKYRTTYPYANFYDNTGGYDWSGYIQNFSLNWVGGFNGKIINWTVGETTTLMKPFVCYFQDGPTFRVAAYWSTDDGETWASPTIIIDDATNEAYEPSFVYLGSGKILGLIRCPADSHIRQIRSDDYGSTWDASLSDTGWDNGSCLVDLQYDSGTNLLFATTGNRTTYRDELRIVDADEAWSDATVWGSAPSYNYGSAAWQGYRSIKLVSGNSSPMFHIAHVAGDDPLTYQAVYCAVPTRAWDGEEGNTWTLYDASKYEQHLLTYGSGYTKPSWVAGKFGGTPINSFGRIFLGGNVLNAFTDVRFTKCDGDTELYYYEEERTDGRSALFAVKALKVGSSKLTGDSGTDAVCDVSDGTVFAAGDYVVIKDDDHPDGQVNRIASISTNELTFDDNFTVSYLAAKNARVCHAIYVYYDKSNQSSHGAQHDEDNTFDFADNVESGVVGGKWTWNAAFGDLEYSTSEWRRGSKSLYMLQTSAVSDHWVNSVAFANNLASCRLSAWILQPVAGDYLVWNGRGDVDLHFTHAFGELAANDLKYYVGAGFVDTGFDYDTGIWTKYEMLCTASDDVVVWKKNGIIIYPNTVRNAWGFADQIQFFGDNAYDGDYWYLDEIIARNWQPSLTYGVGSEEEAAGLAALGIGKVDGVDVANIAKIDGVLVADIAVLDGVS